MASELVRLIGFPATLIHGDALVLQRWLWLRRKVQRGAVRTLDVGCGTGAFTIGSALLGNQTLGLSWDSVDLGVATQRAEICHAYTAKFEQCDVRLLDKRVDLFAQFDQILCCEIIEHILDDQKLVRDMAACLKPGGKLFLTTPHLHLRAIFPRDRGPFTKVENGDHVRCGYTHEALREICNQAGLEVIEEDYLCGFLSQKLSMLRYRLTQKLGNVLSWGLVLLFRLLPPLLDPFLQWISRYPYYCVCLIAQKKD